MNPDFLELSIRELSRNFGRRRALSRVSFDCRAGEIVGLLGPNGSGKSTLLAVLSTLMTPSSGEVLYGGVSARGHGAALRARLGVLSHDLHLYSELTARENLEFFASLYGIASAADVISHALERARLTARAGDVIQGFSRGMRQRLALERALLHAPRLLLLDEPFTGLDDVSTHALISRLAELRSQGCITLLATHDLDIAETVLDRAVVLDEGRLVAVETDVSDLRRKYRGHLIGTVQTT